MLIILNFLYRLFYMLCVISMKYFIYPITIFIWELLYFIAYFKFDKKLFIDAFNDYHEFSTTSPKNERRYYHNVIDYLFSKPYRVHYEEFMSSHYEDEY